MSGDVFAFMDFGGNGLLAGLCLYYYFQGLCTICDEGKGVKGPICLGMTVEIPGLDESNEKIPVYTTSTNGVHL